MVPATASRRFCWAHVVLPGGRVRILEVGHEDVRARVERVDHHLPVDRARDLDAAAPEVARGGRDLPAVVLADMSRLFEEVGQRAGGELALALRAAGEQLEPARVE